MPDKKSRIHDMLASASNIADSAERSRKYRNIVGILSMEATRSNDVLYLEEAFKTAGLVTEDAAKAYVDIIKAMAKIGADKKDGQILRDAIKITERIDTDLDLSVALHEIAFAFAKIAIDKKSEEIFSHSLELIHRIPLNTFCSMAFRNVSRLLAGSDPEKALGLLEKAIELIEKSKTEPVYLVSAFCDIASLLSRFNDERSYGFIRKAIALAEDITEKSERSAVLLKIVETESVIGTEKNDAVLLKEAAKISEGITREYYKTLALDAIFPVKHGSAMPLK